MPTKDIYRVIRRYGGYSGTRHLRKQGVPYQDIYLAVIQHRKQGTDMVQPTAAS